MSTAFPVDEAYIKRAEQQLGRRLPTGLRERLMRENGGDVLAEGDIWRLHPVFDDTDSKRIARTASHIIRETETARECWYGFPQAAIVIAAGDYGDLIVLLPGSDEYHLWSHAVGTHRPVNVDLTTDTRSP